MTNRLQERRLLLELTQPQVSAKLKDVEPRADVGMVSRYEKGVCLPTKDQLTLLEELYGVPRTELYDPEELDLLDMPRDSPALTAGAHIGAPLHVSQGGNEENERKNTAPPPSHVGRPSKIQVNGLDSIAKLVRNEHDMVENHPIYIRVVGPRKVEVFSTYDDTMTRDYLYEAVCDAPDFRGGWRGQEEAIIELRSAFVPNEGTEYLLDLLSRISKDESVTSEDNGVSQTVSARQGIALKSYEKVRSRIPLSPYRTFTEITQPESEFILRLDENGRVGLIEADGGFWKLAAKASIAAYFEEALKEEIDGGRVVVMM